MIRLSVIKTLTDISLTFTLSQELPVQPIQRLLTNILRQKGRSEKSFVYRLQKILKLIRINFKIFEYLESIKIFLSKYFIFVFLFCQSRLVECLPTVGAVLSLITERIFV